MKQAVAIRHVAFEDLGILEPLLCDAGYAVRYLEAGVDVLADPALDEADLLVVLGGPIGAYEEAAYPFISEELSLLHRRLQADRPTLGICLGAQLMARALGSKVYATGTKEIGWGTLKLTDAARDTPLQNLEGAEVLHWHGDTFYLPEGCTLLASTKVCRNQAYSRGPNLLGLQFHPEVDARGLERWLIGHACELAGARIDPAALRKKAREAAPALVEAGTALFREWLGHLA